MAMRYCVKDQIAWPLSQTAGCPVCGEPLIYDPSNRMPDPDWDEKLRAARAPAEEAPVEVALRRPPVLEASKIQIRKNDLVEYVTDMELRAAGMPPGWIESFALFELDGDIWEIQGRLEAQRGWWVRNASLIDPEEFERELDAILRE